MSLPAWRFCNVIYRLITSHLSSKEREQFDRDLARQAKALENLAAIRSQPGTPAMTLRAVRAEKPKIGRWHREAPPGWDDATVQRDAQRALRGLSRRPDVEVADG